MPIKSPPISEYVIHKQISDYLVWVLLPDAYFATVENSNQQGGVTGKIKQAKNKARGVKSGFPDMLIIYKGQIFCIEIKRAGKDATDNQSLEHDKIRRAGGIVTVAHNVEEVRIFLKQNGIPTRESNYV